MQERGSFRFQFDSLCNANVLEQDFPHPVLLDLAHACEMRRGLKKVRGSFSRGS